MKNYILIAFAVLASLSAKAQQEKQFTAFREDFNDASLENFRYGSAGSMADFKWETAVASPSEPGTKVLSLKLDPDEAAGAGKGPEIISKDFTHFGTYSARLKIPNVRKIQPNAGAVVGYFTYHVDSIPGLSEIDFEWLIADPEIIYVGTWTGQRDSLVRIGRTINLAKGDILYTIHKVRHDGKPTPLTGSQNQPEIIDVLEGYDASARFYTYGFDWYPDRLRWWVLHPTTGMKIVLWDYQGSPLGIPQNHSHYRMNFWHTNNWSVETNPNSIEKPRDRYELEVDWMSYEPMKKRTNEK